MKFEEQVASLKRRNALERAEEARLAREAMGIFEYTKHVYLVNTDSSCDSVASDCLSSASSVHVIRRRSRVAEKAEAIRRFTFDKSSVLVCNTSLEGAIVSFNPSLGSPVCEVHCPVFTASMPSLLLNLLPFIRGNSHKLNIEFITGSFHHSSGEDIHSIIRSNMQEEHIALALSPCYQQYHNQLDLSKVSAIILEGREMQRT